ncbi:MAG: T9SS type A sorting domain-containing protein, partial [Flavobacterium sp.]
TTAQGAVIISGGEFTEAEQVRFKVTGDLSINDVSQSMEVVLYPNPVQHLLQVNMNTTVAPHGYEVYNALGQKLFIQTLQGTKDFEINTATLPQGVYFLKIAVEENFITKQFIKK